MSIWEKAQEEFERPFEFDAFKKLNPHIYGKDTKEKAFVFGRSPAAVNENFSQITWTPKKSVVIDQVYCYTTMDDVPLSNFFLINEFSNANVLFQTPDSQSIVNVVGSGLLSVLRIGFDGSSNVKTVKINLVGGVAYQLIVQANQLAAPAVAFRGFCYIGYKEVDL